MLDDAVNLLTVNRLARTQCSLVHAYTRLARVTVTGAPVLVLRTSVAHGFRETTTAVTVSYP